MTLDNMTGITKGSYAGDMFCKSQLITCNRVKECNGVCPFEDALKHADQTQTMNEQHIINHDRDWIIGCIQHDGFIHTHRFDKANQIILEALHGWIPCSERLPDIGDTFLVTVMVGTEIKTDVASNFGSYIDGFWDTFNDWIEDEECHVIAWMPLPEPYREDGEA